MAKRKLEENDISTIEDDEFKSFSDRDEQIDELSNGHAKHRENNAQESDEQVMTTMMKTMRKREKISTTT